MTLRYDDICPAGMEPEDYPSYAVYLDQTLDRYTAAFREAKLYAMMKSQIKLSKKLKDATKCPWLQEGKLVVVFYPSTMSDDQFVVSAKLAMQWKGPFRIIKIYRNAVSLEHLDGTFFAKRSIRDLYPYNREFEELYQAADKYTRPLTDDESTSWPKAQALSPAKWRLPVTRSKVTWIFVRVDEILDDGTYRCQAYNTQDSKLRIGKRKYLPVYVTPRNEEKYTTSPRSSWDKYLMDFPITQLKYHPFQLTNEEEIPEFVCRKIQTRLNTLRLIMCLQDYTGVGLEPVRYFYRGNGKISIRGL